MSTTALRNPFRPNSLLHEITEEILGNAPAPEEWPDERVRLSEHVLDEGPLEPTSEDSAIVLPAVNW